MNELVQQLQGKADRRIMIDRLACEKSLVEFVKRGWHILEPLTPYVHERVVEVVAEVLEAVTRGEINRVLINVPPGTMKSLLVSVFWPAWEWGPQNKPGYRYLGVAHELGLAVRDATKMRRLVKSDWYQKRWPHVAISDDQDAKLRFENTDQGFRVAKSAKGITGERGDRVIFDDPHSVKGADSETQRADVVQNFREALNTRINDAHKSAIVVVMQRIHEMDVSGFIIENLTHWHHVCLPMRYDAEVASEHDWRTVHGELLAPTRFNEAAVYELEDTLGPYAAAGQLQQRPAPREGGLFDPSEIEYLETAPRVTRICAAWDFAASVPKPGQKPDWTVRVKMGLRVSGDPVILHVKRFRKNPTGVEAELKGTAKADGRRCRIRLPQDPGAAGKSQVSSQKRMLAGYTVKSKPVTGSKITRAEPFSAQVGGGNVAMVRGEWNQMVIDEMQIFPGGKHDDIIDACSDAYDELINEKWVGGGAKVTGSTF